MIEIKNVSLSYPISEKEKILALSDISLILREGESVAIIGPNGSGKSTFAKLLNALVIPNSGEVIIDGLTTNDKKNQGKIRLKTGMVFQNPDNQIISTTVEREIAFGLENLVTPHEIMKDKVKKALKEFHLEKYDNFPPHKLSGGEKQRVALAAVLVMEPKYLVLDEPTSLLDPWGRKEVLKWISKISQDKTKTIIHITQFSEETLWADRLLVLSEGKIVFDDKPAAVFEKEEQLKRLGLEMPFIFEIKNKLKKHGINLEEEICDLEKLIGFLSSHKKIKKQLVFEFADKIKEPQKSHLAEEKSTPLPLGQSLKESSEKKIIVKNLAHIYNQKLPFEKRALDEISFEIKQGEKIGVVGPTGSGKSTLVQHLNALLFPNSGEVIIDGMRTTDKKTNLKKLRNNVGLVFQFPENQLFADTVFEDIAFGLKNQGASNEEIKSQVEAALEIVGMDFDKFAFRSPFSLSGGEQRKVAIAGILALKPEILILDEPTAGLDCQSTHQLEKILEKVNGEGTTVILVSHNLDVIARVSNKIIFLNEGKVLFFGDKESFFQSELMEKVDFAPPRKIYLIKKLRERNFKIESLFVSTENLAEKIAVQME
jgi:energy-coupling factor transporter ATPase